MSDSSCKFLMGELLRIERINRNNFVILLVHGLAILIVNERLSSIVLSLLTSVAGLDS